MKHSFNVGLAEKYGMEGAVLIENIAFWIKNNIMKNNNHIDGEYWVYNSYKSFSKIFPYINQKKIQRVLTRLEELNVIKSGNFNKSSYDRTKWYCIVDLEIKKLYNLVISDETKVSNACSQKVKGSEIIGSRDISKLDNPKGQSVQPIPVIKTIIKTDIKTTTRSKNSNGSFVAIKEKLQEAHLESLTCKNIMKVITNKKITLERLTEVIDFSLSHNKSSGFIVSALRDNYVLNNVSKNNNSIKRSKLIDEEIILSRKKIKKEKQEKEEELNRKKTMDNYFNSLSKENKIKIMNKSYSLAKEKYGCLWKIMGKTKVKYDVLKGLYFS